MDIPSLQEIIPYGPSNVARFLSSYPIGMGLGIIDSIREDGPYFTNKGKIPKLSVGVIGAYASRVLNWSGEVREQIPHLATDPGIIIGTAIGIHHGEKIGPKLCELVKSLSNKITSFSLKKEKKKI